jgi:hypothetical protein
MFKRIGLALIAVLSCASLAAVAQMWGDYPILGGASFCYSTQNSATQNQCIITVPAGPSMTGLETFPADTNPATASGPATVKVPFTSVGLGPYVYNAPLTGATITMTAQQRRLIIDPAGTISTLTVVMPAASTLVDGQLFNLCTTQIVSTLTVTAGSGTTVNSAPTALLVPVTTGGASCVGWLYRTANTTWYRVQ